MENWFAVATPKKGQAEWESIMMKYEVIIFKCLDGLIYPTLDFFNFYPLLGRCP